MTQEKARNMFTMSFEVAMKLALPFLLGVAGWTFTELRTLDNGLREHDSRLIRIESTRYTREMATTDLMAVTSSMSGMRDNQADIQGVQQAVLARVTNIEAMLNRLLDKDAKNNGGSE